jgi:hypothetical protein
MINKINKERRCSMNATPYDLATRTSGKELRRTPNKNRTGHKNINRTLPFSSRFISGLNSDWTCVTHASGLMPCLQCSSYPCKKSCRLTTGVEQYSTIIDQSAYLKFALSDVNTIQDIKNHSMQTLDNNYDIYKISGN